MPVIPRVRRIEFISPQPRDPDTGGADIRVHLEDGGASSFPTLTPRAVSTRMNEAGQDFFYGDPVLFVKRLDQAGLARSVEAMAADMSGFWLRYYNSKRGDKKAKARKAPKLRVDAIAITDEAPAQTPGQCSAAVQVSLADGRQFSILAATPSWFVEAFAKVGLDYYFGPLVLFVRSMDLSLVRRAVTDMVKAGDQWLCRYDTPRTTLDKVLAEFKAKHP